MEYAKNILEFREKSRDKVGSYESEMFDVELEHQLDEHNITSPIEQLLFVALNASVRLMALGNGDVIEIDGSPYIMGVRISPQFVIGKYRVDFLISYYTIGVTKGKREQNVSTLVIECDSQQFHDRTEKERRYEKERDRFIQSRGYKVFRYTGSEIVKSPFKVAGDIIQQLTGLPEEDVMGSIELY